MRRSGPEGEAAAARMLERAGWRIVARNWRAGRTGELDIVALDGRTLVIVEVKAAAREGYGDPVARITPAKQRQLARLAQAFVAVYTAAGRSEPVDAVRFDVVTVDLRVAPPTLAHLVDAFRPEADDR